MGKTYTSNYNLTKDDENEFYNVAVQSENMELIDGALKALSDEKVSHIEGKGLSTNDYSDAEKQKLAKIPEDAIDYQHPATHSLDMITETGARKIFSSAERTKLSGIDEGANNYTHPSSHSLDMITETAAKKIMTSAERSKLAGIASGAQVNTVTSVAGKTGAVSLAKADVGLSSVANYGVATTAEAEAGTSNSRYMTPLRVKEAISNNVTTTVGAGNNDTSFHLARENTFRAYASFAMYDSTVYLPENVNGKVFEGIILVSGTYRLDLNLRTNNTYAETYARIYKNGVPYGQQRYLEGDGPTTFVEDLSFKRGDKIQIYGYSDASRASWNLRACTNATDFIYIHVHM